MKRCVLAQLNYLKNADDFARHPYYWASIGVLGKSDAIQFDSYFMNYFWTGIGLILLILLFGLYFKYRKVK